MSLIIEATEARGVIDVEVAVYQATVMKVEPADGTFDEQVKFTFRLDEHRTEDGYPVELWGWVSQKLNPMSKLWRWVVFLGAELDKGTAFDMEDLVGKSCSLLVIREETDKGVRCKVKDVLRAKQKETAFNISACSRDDCSQEPSYRDLQGYVWCDMHGPSGAEMATVT